MIHLLIVALVIGIGIGLGQRLVTPRRSPPGWYRYPGEERLRYWDGTAWTGYTSD